MEYQTIRWERDEAIGIVRLYRPERMNAVTEQMYLELQDCFATAERDDAVRVVLLTGAVLRRAGHEKQAFCAGADLKQHAAGERTHAQKRAYIELAHETTRRIHELEKPVIAVVNGPARGAGTEMALGCDFVLMADEATLAFPETSLGTFVGGGVTYHLPRLVGPARAKELVYTGRVVGGKEAVELGLALRCFPTAQLMDEARALARQLAEQAPLSLRFAKRRLQQWPVPDLGTVLQLETDAILHCMDTEDWQEGVRAFAEKRKPEYRGV